MKKTKSKIIALVLVFVMLIPTISLGAQATATEETELIPIRAAFEGASGNVEWNDEDWSIHIDIMGSYVVLFVGENTAYVNGSPVTLQQPVSLWQARSFMTEADMMTLMAALMGMDMELITLHLTEEARDIALYDFDYMANATLENGVWDYVVYNRFGFSLEELFEQNRDMIYNMEPLTVPAIDAITGVLRLEDDARSLAANYLYSLLFMNVLVPLENTGHLMPLSDWAYALIVGVMMDILAESMDYVLEMFFETFEYYAYDTAMLETVTDVDSFMDFMIEMAALGHVDVPMFNALFDPAVRWFYGEGLRGEVEAFSQNPDNVWTQTITPGQVAFMGIDSFANNSELDNAVILPLLQSIEDYDHLIIDIRGNGGGNTGLFNRLVLSRLISEPLAITHYEFFAGSDVATTWVHDALDNEFAFAVDMAAYDLRTSVVPATDFLRQNDMPNFNRANLDILRYVAIWEYYLLPAQDSINFDGKIWLLVDERSGSASAGVTRTALNTGFATVVGENTQNVMAVVSAYLALPNTGILWWLDVGFAPDICGRLGEVNGFAPNVRNLPDMDALETVLSLIEAGDY